MHSRKAPLSGAKSMNLVLQIVLSILTLALQYLHGWCLKPAGQFVQCKQSSPEDISSISGLNYKQVHTYNNVKNSIVIVYIFFLKCYFIRIKVVKVHNHSPWLGNCPWNPLILDGPCWGGLHGWICPMPMNSGANPQFWKKQKKVG